ncbi:MULTISPECIES: N-acetyl sugar amidotransferase [unclassified Thalassospira]|uniref:N-acetyl sugar amidotransferase n=1 Tax=unclassified Thalassospira TaxID=2648997 RepID=UPI001B1D69A1|nr:N-acetyl sugar amidotransferase [Thalassospira sp.]MBO6769746.1 N-acetyl sugar amidotransferase [Thalassospira sp.]
MTEARTHEVEVKICTRCVYDEHVPNITFDKEGVCNFCKLHDSLEDQYPNKGAKGQEELAKLISEMKQAGKGKKFDCVVGVSGGCDSSYLLHVLVREGVRPLAVHFDNTWNSPVATQNIHKIVSALDIELSTYVVNNKEYDDIYRAFMAAGVADIEAPTDIGFISALYLAAEKHGIKHLVEGHSFRTEGVSPLGWLYMDGKYIESVHKAFGKLPMKTYPNMTLSRFLRWVIVRGIKRVRPLYYMDYDKSETKKLLAERYGWEWYGGHHLENRFTAFYHSYFMPKRFGVDQRANGYAALARSGQMSRVDALAALREPPHLEDEILDLVKKRLSFSGAEFEKVMSQPLKSWRDFKTYKKTFERLRPLFYILTKIGRVPESFYIKFCFPWKKMGDITSERSKLR